MSEEEQAPFEIWAVVDLFGHTRVAGKVSEQVVAGAGFVRLDIPETSGAPAHTRFFSPKAVYSIVPVDEEIARRVAQSLPSPMIVSLTAPVQELTLQEQEDFDEDHPF